MHPTKLVLVALCAPLAATNAASPEFHAEVAGDSPSLWYRLNEATGDAINHGSLGANFNATYNGTVTRAVATSAGDAGVRVDSVDDFLESIATSPMGLTGNPTFSCEAIFFIPAGATASLWPPFLHWGDFPANRTGREVYFSLASNFNNQLFGGFYNGGVRPNQPIQLGAWNHCVWVRQGGGNALTGSTLYVNGVQVSAVADANLCCNTLIPDVTQSRFRINRARDATRFFQGTLDEIVLYDYALSADEVCRHFDAFFTPVKGDMNCDGFITVGDIGGFVQALISPPNYEVAFPCCDIGAADVNLDGFITVGDIGGFVTLLTGG